MINAFLPVEIFREENRMKIVCAKSELMKSLNIVLKAVPSKTTMTILECILIDAQTNKVKFTANDMELGIETEVKGEVLEKGMICLDAKIFSDIIRKLPDNDVTIETDESMAALITCEKAKFKIMGKDGEDFSALPIVEKSEPLVLSQFTLKEVINQTIFSIAVNDTNKIMTGEYFELTGNNLRVVSLDGHRVSIRRVELKNQCSEQKVIVPGKTLQEISRIISDETESMISIYFTKSLIMFEFDDTIVVSRLIEGKYFNIDQMLSTDYETSINVNRRQLLDCIDRSTLLVKSDDKKPIVLNITDSSMELKINSQIGSMDEDVSIVKEGRDIMIGFNQNFMIDALRAIPDETVDIYFINSKSPCFIRDKDQSYIYLILPVNFIV